MREHPYSRVAMPRQEALAGIQRSLEQTASMFIHQYVIYTQAASESGACGACDFPVFVPRCEGRTEQSCLEHRYHVYPFTPGLGLSGRGDGLVQSVRPELGARGDAGRTVLS